MHLRNVGSELDSNASSLHSNDENEGRDAQKQLGRRLRAAYCKSTASDKDAVFIPISKIESILTQETVQDILKQEFPELQSAESKPDLDKLTQDICPSRRRLFALLLLNLSAGCIKCFVNCGVTDMDFPFAQAPNSSELTEVHPRGDVEYQRPVDCFSEWKPSEVEWFLRWQHVVASPFFDLAPESLYLYILPKDSVLPFIESESAGEGGHANVWKVLIHPAHHNCPSEQVRNWPPKSLNVFIIVYMANMFHVTRAPINHTSPSKHFILNKEKNTRERLRFSNDSAADTKVTRTSFGCFSPTSRRIATT